MITVRTEKETFTVKLPEKESQEAFWKIVDILRNPVRGGENIENTEPFCEQKAEILPEEQVEQTEVGHKGFLHIVCPECGESASFCTKKPITERTCRKCGHSIKLENLVDANMDCECGRHFRYKTNGTEPMLEISCISCSTPVAMNWNEKKKMYQTVK